jgi:hypothetical protein
MGNNCKFSIRSELAAPLPARDQKCTVLTICTLTRRKKIFELKSAWPAMTAARSGWVTIARVFYKVRAGRTTISKGSKVYSTHYMYSNERGKIFELKSARQAMTAARSGWVTFVSFHNQQGIKSVHTVQYSLLAVFIEVLLSKGV